MAAFMDIDAKVCFDNQIRNLIALNTRQLRADKNIARCSLGKCVQAVVTGAAYRRLNGQ